MSVFFSLHLIFYIAAILLKKIILEEGITMKIIIYTVLAAIVVGLSVGGAHLYKVSKINAKEMAQYEGQGEAVRRLPGRTLIVYYSLSGHTKDIAERIQKMTGGELYEVKTAEEINRYPWFYLTLKKQLKEKNYPALSGKLPDFSKYNTIFVGAPVWWYTVATPMLSFLQQADFAGKKVVPFSTQGSNYGTYFEDFAAAAKNAKIQKSASFNNMPEKYNQAVDNKIAAWINSL